MRYILFFLMITVILTGFGNTVLAMEQSEIETLLEKYSTMANNKEAQIPTDPEIIRQEWKEYYAKQSTKDKAIRVWAMPDYTALLNTATTIWGRADGLEIATAYNYKWEIISTDTTITYTGTINDQRYISTTHTFDIMKNYTCRLTITNTDTSVVDETSAETEVTVYATNNEDAKRDKAIADGLRYLHTIQRTNGAYSYYNYQTPGDDYSVGITGLALLAFENQGYNPGATKESIYTDGVKRALDFLWAGADTMTIFEQPAGDPDGNNNNVGIRFAHGSTGQYANGIAMLTIIASGTPNEIVFPDSVGKYNTYIAGRTYWDIMQDVVDFCAWSQTDMYHSASHPYFSNYYNTPGHIDSIIIKDTDYLLNSTWYLTCKTATLNAEIFKLSYRYYDSSIGDYVTDTLDTDIRVGQTYHDSRCGEFTIIRGGIDSKDEFELNDYFSWSTNETNSRGGWRYSVSENAYDSDNSFVQWPALGMEAAEYEWGIRAPSWVKTELFYWLKYSQHSTGGFCYDQLGYWINAAKTGAAICSYSFLKVSADEPPVQKAIEFLDTYWDSAHTDLYKPNGDLIGSNHGSYYAMYAVMKGCRTIYDNNGAQITMIGNRDWYAEFTNHLLNTDPPNEDGSWSGDIDAYHSFSSGWSVDCQQTAFPILILSPGVFRQPPVAKIKATTSIPPNIPLALNGLESYHQDPDRIIVEWEWDFDASDGTDWLNPDARGKLARVPNGYSLEGTTKDSFYITLRVKGSGNPAMYDTDVFKIYVSEGEDHPPIARVGGPYFGKIGNSFTLDASGSSDPDGDTITGYNWDLDGDGEFDDATGITVTFKPDNKGEGYRGFCGVEVSIAKDSSSASDYTSIWTSNQDVGISVANINIEPPTVNWGSSVNISGVNVTGTLETALVDSVDVRFYGGHPDTAFVLVGSEQWVKNITAGNNVPVPTIDWSTASLKPEAITSTYRLWCEVDPSGDRLKEWNEDNNRASSNNITVQISSEIGLLGDFDNYKRG